MYDLSKRERMEAHPIKGTRKAFKGAAKKRKTTMAKLVASVLEEKAEEFVKAEKEAKALKKAKE